MLCASLFLGSRLVQAGGITVMLDMLTVNALSDVDRELVVQLLCDIVWARPDCIQAFLSHQSVTAIITNLAVSASVQLSCVTNITLAPAWQNKIK
jgi:hypothetical protein